MRIINIIVNTLVNWIVDQWPFFLGAIAAMFIILMIAWKG